MYCPNCGKDIADEAVVCVGCGRPVTPVGQLSSPGANLAAGAKNVHDTAQSFLVIGILNIIAGAISIGAGWVIGIFAVIVGIIELVNAYKFWPTPPRSTSNPTYLPVLEMIAVVSGSLWSIFAGISNRKRLAAPETKAYFAALQSGQPVVLETVGAAAAPGVVSSAPVAASQTKQCPSCGNTIPLQAKICQFCRQEFADEEIQQAVKAMELNLAQNQAVAAQKSLIRRCKTLRVIGAILAGLGVLVLLISIFAQVISTAPQDNVGGFIGALFICPIPLNLAGGGFFAWGIKTLNQGSKQTLPQPVVDPPIA